MASHTSSMLAGMTAAGAVTMLGSLALGTLALATGALAGSTGANDITPGTWTIAATIADLQIPGLPAATAARMANGSQNAPPRKICVRSKPGKPPPAAMFHALAGECSYESWNIAGDKLTAALVCKAAEGAQGSARVTLAGQIAPDRLVWRAETRAVDEAGTMQMRMISDASATRKDGCAG